jgi:hypothetical protein
MSLAPSSGEVAVAASSREAIERRILIIRGLRVMLDHDLADLYGVETGALVRAMKRNSERFPEDFAFQLSAEEWDNLRCQIGISSEAHGGRRFAPYVFTEQGVAMLSSVCESRFRQACTPEAADPRRQRPRGHSPHYQCAFVTPRPLTSTA